MPSRKELAECQGFDVVVAKIGGKWKLWILRVLIFGGTKRFNELRRELTGITQTTLTNQLRALEKDGLISRKVYAEIPPKVEYQATDTALGLEKFFVEMHKWATSSNIADQ